jgi:hypothetical protein
LGIADFLNAAFTGDYRPVILFAGNTEWTENMVGENFNHDKQRKY